MGKRQVTLADIARELNISTATVSRALKGYPDISPETKKKVKAMAKTLNYRPNTLAAGLRNRESKVIGVIIPEIVNHFFSGVIKGIMQVAYESDYRVMLCQSDESYDKEVADARALLASRVDGILVSLAHETHQFEHLREFQDLGIPLVLFDKVTDELECSKVIVDDHAGAFQAVEHLINNGYHRIAHFAGPQSASTSFKRLRGYIDALKAHKIPINESWIYYCEDITIEEGANFALDVMSSSAPPEAIFTVNDAVAIGAMNALKKKGYKIPEDVAFVGFSNWMVSSVIDPPLSSVAQPSFEMGKIAAKILLQEIASEKEADKITHEIFTLKTSLEIRTSSQYLHRTI